MPVPERDETPPRAGTGAAAGLSMRDLLASCAAAKAVSTPPRDPAPRTQAPGTAHAPDEHRRAA
ncbi:hypothetical protein ABZ845_04760 [Streptomyces sp. NPDC047022]|uniref:hypothetical protein n=1 Tax=Streptomyces sp. NPDC047022 TaxID=3155737 RepID=UPI0033E6BCA2